MKKQRTPSQLQPVTPEAYVYIQTLMVENSAGFEERCARYRRRATIRRCATAVCIISLFIVNVNSVFSNPPQFTVTKVSGSIDALHAGHTFYAMLNQL